MPATTATPPRPDTGTVPRPDQLRLFVQPVVSLTGGTLSGWEALVRGCGAPRVQEDPSRFIPRAERSGAIHGIGRWVLGNGLRWLACMAQEGTRLAVNVSVVQIERPGFDAVVLRALRRHDIPAWRLMLEVTETAAVTDPDLVVHALSRLRDAGVTIAVDDVGTGFADVDLVRALPASVMKLDEGLVGALPDPFALERIEQWMALADRLGMAVVAEGVRTGEQAALVTELGCRWAQGELFGRPHPAWSPSPRS